MNITVELVDKIHGLIDQGLVRGLGSPEPGKMCVEAAVNYALGHDHGDDPGCVAQSVRRLKIRLNDSNWSSNKARAEGLRRLAIAQLGTSNGFDEQHFARRCALSVAHLWDMPAIVRQYLETGDETIRKDAAAAADAAADAASAAARAADAAATYAARAAARAADADADADAADAAATYAARAAARAADADADADAYAADAADAADADAFDNSLADFVESIVQILIEMKTPGSAWL